jgi:hypothetical protein
MMAAIAIDHLCTSFPDEHIGVAYIYCNYKEHGSQSALSLLTALMKQLSQSQRNIPESVQRLYNDHYKQQTRPPLDEICNILRSICTVYSRVFIVVDALDECTQKNGERGSLIDKLRNLQAGTNVSIMATARLIPDIEQKFESATKLEVRASDSDVRRYVAGQIQQLPNCIQHDDGLWTDVQDKITKSVDGM